MTKDFRIFLKGEELTDDIIRYQKLGNRYNVIFKNSSFEDEIKKLWNSDLKEEN